MNRYGWENETRMSESIRGYLHARGVRGGESSVSAEHQHTQNINPQHFVLFH